MKDATRPLEAPRREPHQPMRSTGDSRKIIGKRYPRQTTQPSLGDPENAPGPAAGHTEEGDRRGTSTDD